jgi:hypothetical protein
MPREKKYLRLIPRIYKRNYEDIALYFWVEAQRELVPALTIEQCIMRYFKYICIEDYNLESAISTYSILKREFYESAKTDK